MNRSQTLPAYSPATDTPRYTSEPQPDEERVDINRRVAQEESGVYVEKNKYITIALPNQVPDCKQPTYGKAGRVEGALSLSNPEAVLSVEVTLVGTMELMMTSAVLGGSHEVPLCMQSALLYRKPDTPTTSDSKRTPFPFSRTPSTPSAMRPQLSGAHCPSTLVFSLQFPVFYSNENISYPLPPSFSHRFGGIPARLPNMHMPGISLESRYTLRATIVKKGSLVEKKAFLTIPIVFQPRSRPSQPSLPPSMTFLSTLKSSPEEWKLFESETGVKAGSEGTPVIHSAVLIPQSQVYPLDHPIPFHIQLSSTSAEMLTPFTLISQRSTDHPRDSSMITSSSSTDQAEALHPASLNPPSSSKRPSSSSTDKRHSHNHDTLPRGSSLTTTSDDKSRSGFATSKDSRAKGTRGCNIEISIQRQVAVEVRGQWVQIKKPLSVTRMKPCAIHDGVLNARTTSLAWEGQVEVRENFRQCGGFFGAGVRVRDFISLTIMPPDPDHSLVRAIHQLIPIRLTTDPYTEEPIRGMELVRRPAPS